MTGAEQAAAEPDQDPQFEAAAYEWLLSDHPDARAERQRRREATYQADMARSLDILAWAVRVSSIPGATGAERDLAETMAPSAARSAERAEASFAVPDADYVAKARTDWENFRRAEDPDYRYPDRYIGATASSQPRPDPEPQLEAEP
jgi:hypothetical protein